MYRSKKVAIILADTFKAIGVQSILASYFNPIVLDLFDKFESIVKEDIDTYDYFITDAQSYVTNSDFFLPRRKNVMIITDGVANPDAINIMPNNISYENAIEQLTTFFNTSIVKHGNNNKYLSTRELEVLKLVVKGKINKEIAEELSISFNTVLTHRKNITAKLGVKTISGLAFFAFMNGYVSSEEIQY